MDGHPTSLSQQPQLSETTYPPDTSRRIRSKRSSLDLIIAKDNRAHSRRPTDDSPTTSESSRQDLMKRSASEEQARRVSRNTTASSGSSGSFDFAPRRQSKAEQLRYSDRQEDTSLKRASNPLKHRQKKKSLPFEDLPPTPTTAVFFDALSIKQGSEDSRSVSLFSASNVASSSSVDSMWAREKTSAIDTQAVSNNSDERSVDDVETNDSIGTLSYSMSSEIDTPGPITPATPAWKPRELTLLKKSSDVSHDSINSRRADRDRQLVGLGLQSPAFPSEEDIRLTKSSRLLAKDIVPIGNAAHFKSTSPFPGNRQKELKLASASGPPRPRTKSQPRSTSSPMSSSFSQQPRPSLPILPPGPTFSADQLLSVSASSSSSRPEPSPNAFSSDHDFAILYDALDIDSKSLRQSRQEANMAGSPSFSHRATSGLAGSRRKAPPATLDLSPSSASAFSHQPASNSAPTSSVGLRPSTPCHPESVTQGLLSVPRARGDGEDAVLSPFTPNFAQSFHTPMQSPMKPGKASLSAVLDDSPLQRQLESGKQSVVDDYSVQSESQDAIGISTIDAGSKKRIAEEASRALPSSIEDNASIRDEASSLSSDNRSEAKKNSLQVSESSIDSPEVRQPSPDPAVDFNTSILLSTRAAGREESMHGDGILSHLSEKTRGVLSVNPSPTASPRPRSSSALVSHTPEQRSRSNSFAQSRMPLAAPPNLPLPLLPTLLVKSPSNEGRQMQWESGMAQQPTTRAQGSESTNASHSLVSSDSITSLDAHYDRPLPPLPRPKLSLVPDVPSFGYTGPITSRAGESVEPSSPYTSLDTYADFHNEPTSTSHWSSGSESEEEKVLAKSTKKAFKQRKSSSSYSDKSSKKNSMSGGGTSSVASGASSAGAKMTGFFAGLGLRKKSVSSLSSQQASPLPMYTNSLASGRIEGQAEFPFPISSPVLHPRQSISTNTSRRGSNAQMLSPTSTTTFPDGRTRSTSQSSQGMLVSSSRKLVVQPSDAILRTTAMNSMAAPAQFYGASSSSSPAIEREAFLADQDYLRGLGIQVPAVEEYHSDDAVVREAHRTSQQINAEEDEEEQKRPSWRRSKSSPGKEQAEKWHNKSFFGQRKHSIPSLPGATEEKKTSTSRMPSGTSTPIKESFASSNQSSFSPADSLDETPRLAYASLDDSEPRPEHKTRDELDDDAAGSEVWRHSVVRSPSQGTLASAATISTSGRIKRIRVERASSRPRYSSLTDVGRQWMDEHPDVAFGGAQGLDLLFNVLSGEQSSGGQANGHGSISDESDSSTDDYGSSEGNGGNGSGDASQGGHGAGGDRGDDDDKHFDKRGGRALQEDVENSRSDSEDSYGASDNDEAPSTAAATLSRHRAEGSSCSSDDVPLGQRVRDPDQLQRQLRQMTRRRHDVLSAKAARPEVPSADLNFVLDGNDLIARLLKVQLQREAAEVQVRQGVSSVSSNSAAAFSRNRSMAAGKAPAINQMMPALPLVAGQENRRLPAADIAPLQTANLVSASRIQGQSSPISPDYRPSQPMSSATNYTESSEASMQTALEAQPSSSSIMSQQQDHRSAVIADFANTIRARSRSRSFAMPFSPAQESSRPPPVPSRAVLVPQLNNVSASSTAASLGFGKGDRSPSRDGSSPSGSSIASTRLRSASMGKKMSSSSTEEQESISRVRPVIAAPPSAIVQHRVYLLNKQRCGTAEVEMNARVRDVIHSIMEREPMPIDSRTGGWVLYDVCADLGIERPIREYELISEVIALRSNAQNDYFILKRTELAPYLSFKNVPNSSAALAGWVYVQDNHRKKWNKRWLELRDNCLYSAKTEKGKDEGLLCSLSSFDVYMTDPIKVKTPKQHSFALRSQNSINMFESPEADYVHYFALSDGGASRHWITAILNARTFVLRQEKSYMFRVNTAVAQSSGQSTAIAPVNIAAGGTIEPDARAMPMSRQRSAATADIGSSPLKGGSTTTSPLLTFAQTSFPKGSLMEERFSRSQNEVNTASSSIGAIERKRREDIQLAERKGRKEGKPLVGIIPDVARPTNGLGSSNRL